MVKVGRAEHDVIVNGVEEAQQKINALAKTWINAASGIEKAGVSGSAGVVSSYAKLEGQLASSVKAIDNVDKAMKNVTTTGEKTNTMFGFMRGGLNNMIVTGMFMSIGWQAINGVLTTTTTIIQQLIFGGAALEASMVSLQTVSESTGRSYASVVKLMSDETDAFMTKTALAPGVLRLLSTELDPTQIQQFIQAVKDGSAAMGYQADEQLPLIARGYKQFTANILDNIGVTTYLNNLRRRASDELGIHIDALTEAQMHQALFNEVIEQTAKYSGLYAEQIDTAKGSIAGFTAEWQKFIETSSQTGLIKGVMDFAAEVVRGWRYIGESIEYAYEQKEKFGYFEGSAAGYTPEKFEAQKTVNVILEEYESLLARGANLQTEYAQAQDLMLLKGAELNSEMDRHVLILESANRALAEQTDQGREYVSQLDAINERITLYQKVYTYYADIVDKQTESMSKLRFENQHYEKTLKLVNDALSAQNNLMDDANDKIREYERSLERKKDVLGTNVIPTEDLLKDTRSQLKSAESELERAEDNLWKRVEPKLYKKYMQEESEAEANVTRLREQEKTQTETLTAEVEKLQGQLDEEKKRYVDVSDRIRELNERKDVLSQKIADNTDKILDINEQLYYNRQKLDTVKKALDEETESQVKASKALDTFYGTWKNLVELPDITNKTANYKENRTITTRYVSVTGIGQFPGYQTGTAFVPQTGLYMLHQGESVKTERETREGNTYQIGSISIQGHNMNPQQLFDEFDRFIRLKRARSTI